MELTPPHRTQKNKKKINNNSPSNFITLYSSSNQYVYNKRNPIGEGFSASLYKALNNQNQNVALKIFDIQSDFMNEINCYKEIIKNNLCSKNLICMIDHFISNDEYVIVLPYLENYFDLDKVISSLSGSQIQHLIDSLTDTIIALTKEEIYHNDINFSNILVRLDPFDVKLIDFGNCNIKNKNPDIENDLLKLEKIIKQIKVGDVFTFSN
jgi:serine/threonine protein kinase